jgi:hypothetical protein
MKIEWKAGTTGTTVQVVKVKVSDPSTTVVKVTTVDK